ncbi:MAG: endonuclease domain-containing protein [Planctomycetaceae bacterium]
MWTLVRDRGLLGLKFRRQHPLGPFIADFYCDELRWVIEVDGGQHNTSEARAHDERRSAYLRASGVIVTRFWSSEVMGELDGVVERLVDLAGQIRGGTLTPALSQGERGKE